MSWGYSKKKKQAYPKKRRIQGIHSSMFPDGVTEHKFKKRDDLEDLISVADAEELEEFAKEKAAQIQEENDGVKQIIKDGESVDHTVDILDYEIEIPEGRDEWEVVDEFLTKNKLWKEIPVSDIKDNDTHSFGYRLEKSMVNNVGEVSTPDGSCYLTTDGEWVGGTGIYGYEEDHRPQIKKGLTYAGLKITGTESDSDLMYQAMKMSGMIRVGARGDSLNLDIVKPLTSAQKRAISDYVIENHLDRNNVTIDTNSIRGLNEENIMRQIGVDNDYGENEDYE